MSDDERSSHFGWVRVELEDSTDDEARWYFDALVGSGATLAIDVFEAGVVKVQRDLTMAEQREHDRRRSEERRYHGD